MRMTYTTIQEAAAALFNAFVSDKRHVTGDKFYKLADGSPEWMTDAVHAAHGDMMPDDWRYQFILKVASAIADLDDGNPDDDRDIDDLRHEAVDGAVSVYTSDLTAWLASHVERVGYCDEAFSEGLASIGTGAIGLLQAGQYAEIDEVWGQLVAALEGEVSE